MFEDARDDETVKEPICDRHLRLQQQRASQEPEIAFGNELEKKRSRIRRPNRRQVTIEWPKPTDRGFDLVDGGTGAWGVDLCCGNVKEKRVALKANFRDFLSVVQEGIPDAVGRYMVVRLADGQDAPDALYRLIEMASSSAKAEALIKAVDGVSLDSDALHELIELASKNQDAMKAVTATLNIARYRGALTTLEGLIENNALEAAFQSHLEQNHWLFGTEYGELLDLRHATRDEQQDFIIRRTTDDYIEIIEIKTTLDGQPLFNYDRSHDCHYPGAPLAKVVGQIINYIEQLDADRESLLRRNGLDTNKIRAKIIVGRSGDDAQLKALRNFNGHVHRIEVLTFDQLVRIGRRVLEHLESVIEQKTEPQASTQVVWGEVDSPWDDSDPPF